MKKEKKEILKNSEYYYKKAFNNTIRYTFLATSLMSIFAFAGVYASKRKETDKQYNDLVQSSGYNEYVQEMKEEALDKYENGEISENVYNAYLKNIDNVEFKGYLKEKNDIHSLAKLEEINSTSDKHWTTFCSSAIACSFTIMAVEFTRETILLNKGKKLEKKEKARAEKEKIEDKPNEDIIDKTEISLEYGLDNEDIMISD